MRRRVFSNNQTTNYVDVNQWRRGRAIYETMDSNEFVIDYNTYLTLAKTINKDQSRLQVQSHPRTLDQGFSSFQKDNQTFYVGKKSPPFQFPTRRNCYLYPNPTNNPSPNPTNNLDPDPNPTNNPDPTNKSKFKINPNGFCLEHNDTQCRRLGNCFCYLWKDPSFCEI
jgi:hypothetical protein